MQRHLLLRASGERELRRSLNFNGAPTTPFLAVAVRADASAGDLEMTLSNCCVLRLNGAVD